MTEIEVMERVAELVARQFSLEKADVTAATGPQDIDAWDSLTHVGLTTELERAFGIRFEIEEVMEMENVAAIVRVIAKRLSERKPQ
jgi:acyl carrier protein